MLNLTEKSFMDIDNLDSKRPAGIQALQMLVEKLQEGKFKSGQAIRESVLAKELGFSRNAIREALNQIVGWGIFEYVPYCGYKIRNFNVRDVLEWHEVREAIEPIAARRLARIRPINVLQEMERYMLDEEKATNENDFDKIRLADLKFHLTVVRNSGNRRFSHMQNISYMTALFYFDQFRKSSLIYRICNSTLEHLPKEHTEEDFDKISVKHTILKHREMFEAIKSGNQDKAEKEFREHANIQVRHLENIIMHYGYDLDMKNLSKSEQYAFN